MSVNMIRAGSTTGLGSLKETQGIRNPSEVEHTVELSVIVPVTERFDDIRSTLAEYYDALQLAGVDFELICVLDGNYEGVLRDLQIWRANHPLLKIISLPRSFGEATSIMAGFENSLGRYVLTLPAYQQISGKELPELIRLRDSADMLVACRSPRLDGRVNQAQSWAFSAMVSAISGLSLHDAGCNVRLFRRSVLEEVQLYGDFHRFFPILAHRQGFTVQEVTLRQASSDRSRRVYAPGLYLRRLLDLLTIYFLLRFTKKPFRFFGLIGSGVFLSGAAVTAWVVYERIFASMPLTDRPAFLLGTLLMVFGLQVLSVGLIGEIIIFSHARDLKEYSVKRVVE